MYTIIDTDALPPEERDLASEIQSLLYDFVREARKLESAWRLYQHAYGESQKISNIIMGNMQEYADALEKGEFRSSWPESSDLHQAGDVFGDWCQVAMQGAVISVYTAHKMRVALLGKLGRTPILSGKLDAKERKEAGQRFDKAFPNIEEIRNAIAHVGEIPLKSKELEKHSLKQKVRSEFVVSDGDNGTFIGASYSMNKDRCVAFASMNGRAVSFELSSDSIAAFNEFISLWRKIFEKAESEWTLRSRSVAAGLSDILDNHRSRG